MVKPREPLVLPRRAGPQARWILTHNQMPQDLLAACGTPYRVRACSWPQLEKTVRTAPPSAVVLINPCYPGNPKAPLASAVEIVRLGRMVPVIAYLPFTPENGLLIRELLNVGVSQVADSLTENTPAALRVRLESAHAQSFKQRIEPALSRYISPRGLILIRAMADVVVDRGTVADLAAFFASDDRSITRWATREHLPPPRRLLAWLRIFLGLALLEERKRSVGNAARCAGYTDHSLRRALRLFLGGDTGDPPEVYWNLTVEIPVSPHMHPDAITRLRMQAWDAIEEALNAAVKPYLIPGATGINLFNASGVGQDAPTFPMIFGDVPLAAHFDIVEIIETACQGTALAQLGYDLDGRAYELAAGVEYIRRPEFDRSSGRPNQSPASEYSTAAQNLESGV